MHIDTNAPNSISEQWFYVGGHFGVSGGQILGMRGENGQNDGVFSTKIDVILKNTSSKIDIMTC